MEDFVVLNNGVRMPRVGLGVYAIPVNQTKDAVLTALSLGYRHIDTAQLYKNEAEVGEAVRASGIPRKEIFVTTKLWGARDYEDAKRSIARSQRALGIGVIDLLLIHWPGEDNLGVYKALEEAYQAGDVRAIGISNFVENLFPSFIKQVDVVPAVDQVEAHVFCQQKGLRKMMAEAGVVPEAWSPLGSGEHKIFGKKDCCHHWRGSWTGAQPREGFWKERLHAGSRKPERREACETRFRSERTRDRLLHRDRGRV